MFPTATQHPRVYCLKIVKVSTYHIAIIPAALMIQVGELQVIFVVLVVFEVCPCIDVLPSDSFLSTAYSAMKTTQRVKSAINSTIKANPTLEGFRISVFSSKPNGIFAISRN